MSWRITALEKQHDRRQFDCGDAALNGYLSRFARQNHEKGGAKTFVAMALDDEVRVLGYYTLCPGSLEYARTPKIVKKGLGRYEVPMFRLGRLAVDRTVQGEGLGGELLTDAARRCLVVAAEVGGVGLLIDAKSDRVARWYQGFGAVPLEDSPLVLVLPFATLVYLPV